MNENRGSLYLVTGMVIGAILGVLFAWYWLPVEYIDTTPASLRQDYKDLYRRMIAAAYVSNGDLVRAKARLALLGEADIYRLLAEQAQRTLAEGGSLDEARALGLLAVAIGKESSEPGTPAAGAAVGIRMTATAAAVELPTWTATATREPSATPLPFDPTATRSKASPAAGTPNGTSTPSGARPTATPTVSPSPSPTITLFPTRTLTPTPGAPFALESRERVCEARLPAPLVKVQALNANQEPMPGVEIIVTWDGGEEHFYTGLKPELGLGYADFTLTLDTVYTLRVGEGGQPITNLSAAECTTVSGERFWGAWLLTFVQP